MVMICDLLGTKYAPVSKIPSVKKFKTVPCTRIILIHLPLLFFLEEILAMQSVGKVVMAHKDHLI